MNNRIIPVTLALGDKEETKRLERIVAGSFMVRLSEGGDDEVGVLIYEPGDTVDEDLPHIIQALESGDAEDVFLAGSHADPDILIRAMRSGIREFLQYPIDENDFRAAIMRTAMRGSLADDNRERGTVVTALSGKPGLGSTTLAVNMAWLLNARAPGRTVLLDLRRPVGEVPYFLDLTAEYTWGHLVEDISRLDSTYLHSVVAEHESGLHVLAAPSRTPLPDGQAMHLILEQLRGNYDYVVVDTGWPDDEVLPKEVEQADHILVAMQLTLPSLARTSRLMDAIRGQDPDADRRMHLVANRVTRESTIGVPEAGDVLARPIAWTIPEDGPAAGSAMNQGNPVTAAYPKSAMAKALQRMARELLPEKKKERKGLSLPFGSLFRRRKKETAADVDLAGVIS